MALAGWDANKKIVLEVSDNLPVSYTNGKPWSDQHTFNTSQTGQLSSWVTSAQSLPIALAGSSSVVVKNRVYVFGGFGTAVSSAVYVSEIQADGSLSSWSTGSNLFEGLAYSTAIVVGDKVHLLGGYNASGKTANVYTAVINSDGSLGTWSVTGSLYRAVYGCAAVVIRNRVYLVGGRETSPTSSITMATIKQDGSLSSWYIVDALTVALLFTSIVYTGTKLYAVGGSNSSYQPTSNVYSVDVDPVSGLITGDWVFDSTLPMAVTESSIVSTDSRVYLLASKTTSYYPDSIFTADIDSAGVVSNWRTEGWIVTGKSKACVVATNSKIYLIGGGTSSSTNTVFEAAFAGGLNDYSSVSSEQKVTNVAIPIPLTTVSGVTGEDTSALFNDIGSSYKKIAMEVADTGVECYIEVLPDSWKPVSNSGLIWARVPELVPGQCLTYTLTRRMQTTLLMSGRLVKQQLSLYGIAVKFLSVCRGTLPAPYLNLHPIVLMGWLVVLCCLAT